ncbi:hypothetical protein HOO68_04495 [Candidatus Gracilibacteria bacterium]|nr:hypothetical protein [Candidatus Gracilibacteria bacterium]
MNTLSPTEYPFDNLDTYKDLLQKDNPSGIFSIDGLRGKQDSLPNKGIMQPILTRMGILGNKLREVYKKEVDPITWLAWCYYDRGYSCQTISEMLSDMGIEYKEGSLSQFTMKQCNWIKRPHTHITQKGLGTLRELAITRERMRLSLDRTTTE